MPAAADSLKIVRDLKPRRGRVMQLKQCAECETYYIYETDYEFLTTGSEDEQTLTRLKADEVPEYLAWPPREVWTPPENK